jgi:hypothetical protein
MSSIETKTSSFPRKYSRAPRKRRGGRNKQQNKGYSPTIVVGRNFTAGYQIRAMPFFGYKVRKTLNYFSSGVVISGASSAAAAQVFSANGMFDPDITGTGGQPMSFDQAMSFFNHYTVHKAKIKVTFNSDSTTLRASCGVVVSGSSTVTTVIETLLENGDAAIQQLQYAGTSGSAATFECEVDCARFQDVKDIMDDPNMRGDSASNPTEQMYFHLFVVNLTTAAVVQCEYNCLITYDATFHEPRKGPIS